MNAKVSPVVVSPDNKVMPVDPSMSASQGGKEALAYAMVYVLKAEIGNQRRQRADMGTDKQIAARAELAYLAKAMPQANGDYSGEKVMLTDLINSLKASDPDFANSSIGAHLMEQLGIAKADEANLKKLRAEVVAAWKQYEKEIHKKYYLFNNKTAANVVSSILNTIFGPQNAVHHYIKIVPKLPKIPTQITGQQAENMFNNNEKDKVSTPFGDIHFAPSDFAKPDANCGEAGPGATPAPIITQAEGGPASSVGFIDLATGLADEHGKIVHKHNDAIEAGDNANLANKKAAGDLQAESEKLADSPTAAAQKIYQGGQLDDLKNYTALSELIGENLSV